jgi:hypothetical protein
MSYKSPTSADPLCNVCGLPVDGHPRCGADLPNEEACHVLVGPLHAVTTLIDGLCASCWGAKVNCG